MDYTVYGILQARILQWVAFLFSRGSSQPRDKTQVSRIAGIFSTNWATREGLKSQTYFTAVQVKQIASPGWMHETSAQGWYTGKTQRDGMEREAGGVIGMGNTCKSMAD